MSTTVSHYAHVDCLEFTRRMGSAFAKSKMFGCKTIEQGEVLALTCYVEHKSPAEIARKYHIIHGNLSKKADAMLAEFREAGGKHVILERSSARASIELSLDGQTNQFSFTWEEAQGEPYIYGKADKDGVRPLKDNWASERGRMQMLWARVVSDGVRAVSPEIVAGTYTPEEIEDFARPSQSDVIEGQVVQSDQSLEKPDLPAKDQPSQLTTVHAQIRDLFAELDVPAEKRDEILSRYSVSSIRSLSASDAQELYEKLQAKAVQVAAGSSQVDPAAHSAPSDGPCYQSQVDELKSLLIDISKFDPDIKAKVLAKLQPRTKLSELSEQEAAALIDQLTIKLNKEVIAGK